MAAVDRRAVPAGRDLGAPRVTEETSIWALSEAYERYIGRWSEPIAAAFIEWLNLPRGLRWLDVGCGTGALARAVAAGAAPALVHGIDRSAGFVERAGQLANGDASQRFSTGDALALPVVDGTFDVAVSGLVLNFLDPAEQAVSELRRVLRPGGTVALYVWDYASGMQLIRFFWDAAIELDPSASSHDEARRFPRCQPAELEKLVGAAGLQDVESRSIVAPTVFRDFDDLWTPFLGGQGPAPAYAMALAAADREALREQLRGSLPTRPDGSIALSARAFAVRSTVAP
jgi:SAM-dependent methyltransferase